MKRRIKRISLSLIFAFLTVGLVSVPITNSEKITAETPKQVVPFADHLAKIPEAPAPRQPVIKLADLVVTSITASNPIMQAGKTTAPGGFSITIKNAGTAVSSECKIAISITALSVGSAPKDSSGTKTCPPLAVGETFAFTWADASISAWPHGDYRLTVEVNSSRVYKETNFQNNVRSFDFKIAAAQSFNPVMLTTNTIAATGIAPKQFAPVILTANKITATGTTPRQFTPVIVTTNKLIASGK